MDYQGTTKTIKHRVTFTGKYTFAFEGIGQVATVQKSARISPI